MRFQNRALLQKPQLYAMVDTAPTRPVPDSYAGLKPETERDGSQSYAVTHNKRPAPTSLLTAQLPHSKLLSKILGHLVLCMCRSTIDLVRMPTSTDPSTPSRSR